MILEELNKLKGEVHRIEEDLKSSTNMPPELKNDTIKHLDRIHKDITTLGNIIEKHYQDAELLKKMTDELMVKMSGIDLYSSLTEEQRVKIAERVVEVPELEILDENSFRQALVDYLRGIPDPEKLILKSYGKDSVIKVGGNLIGHKATDSAKYAAGLKAFIKMVETPNGREDALSFGENRILKNVSLSNQYLLSHYGA